MYKTFKDKTFDLKKGSLKKTKMEEEISHYTSVITKKLKLDKLDEENLYELFKVKDIEINQNYNFNKKIFPENFSLINHLLFDFKIKMKKNKKIILIFDKDQKFNRNVFDKVEELANRNKEIDYYYMINTNENTGFIKQRFNLEFSNFPQIIILQDENKTNTIPQSLFLIYTSSIDEFENYIKNI